MSSLFEICVQGILFNLLIGVYFRLSILLGSFIMHIQVLMQRSGFALPMLLCGPIAVIVLASSCSIRANDSCYLTSTLTKVNQSMWSICNSQLVNITIFENSVLQELFWRCGDFTKSPLRLLGYSQTWMWLGIFLYFWVLWCRFPDSSQKSFRMAFISSLGNIPSMDTRTRKIGAIRKVCAWNLKITFITLINLLISTCCPIRLIECSRFSDSSSSHISWAVSLNRWHSTEEETIRLASRLRWAQLWSLNSQYSRFSNGQKISPNEWKRRDDLYHLNNE